MGTFDEDMIEMKHQVTQEVILAVNKSPTLYSDFVKVRAKSDDPHLKVDNVAQFVYEYAEAHDGWFGEVFQPELDVVDWDVVIKGV